MIRKSKFTRQPRSVADYGAILEMWSAVQSLLNGSMTRGGIIKYSDGNVVWDLPPLVAPQQFYPFKVYPLTDLSLLVGKTQGLAVAFSTGASLVPCLIVDINTPTNLALSPPQVSIKDTWRFWAVRSGYVEIRPTYHLTNGVGGANGGMPIVPKFTDFYDIIPYWDNLNYPDEQPFKLYNSDTVVVLGGTPNDNGQMTAALWIQCVSDTSDINSLPTASIAGYTVADFVDNVEPAFVVDNNGVIPVAIIAISQSDGNSPSLNTAINFIFDHVRNRYPCGNGSWPAGAGNSTVVNMRGTVEYNESTAESIVVPSDLLSQAMYPGDSIWFYSFNDDGTTYNSQFIFVGPTAAMFNQGYTYPNPIADPNWKASSPIGLQPLV